MAFGFGVNARVSLKSLAFGLALSVALGSLAIPAAYAGSGEPASELMKKRKKSGASDAAPAASNWSHNTPATGGKATTETGLVTEASVSPFLSPDSAALMQASITKYEQIVSAGGWPSVPSGKLKKGSTGKAVIALNKRLYVEGYLRVEATEGEYAETFTTATEEALKNFQRNHGLAVTGAIDGPTLKALNVPATQRLATLRANAPRIAEYSKDLGERYMVVNVPAMQIETVNSGRVYSRHNAIVGRPSRPTPVVMTPLATVRFNPYWNAPPSIVEKDIVPRMLSSSPSKVMSEMNMKIFQGVGGPEINPNSVNWRRAVVDNYHFRQEPGGSNAMATAKIEFNSPFGIYLHDTPEPHLFASGQRFYSSGCVRVEKVATLINWILQGQDGIDEARIAGLAESKERLDTPIASPPQLRVAYLTGWPTRAGMAAFRPDVYELDGTGFVVGQPLPVGETVAGQRFVLKPIARTPAAVDEAEASGFASLFRRNGNSDKQDAGAIARQSADDDDSFVTGKKKGGKAADAKTKDKAKAKLAKKDGKPTGKVQIGSRNSDKEGGIALLMADDSGKSKDKKKTADKAKAKKKLASATKVGDAESAKKPSAKKKTSAESAETASAKKPGETAAKAKAKDGEAAKKVASAGDKAKPKAETATKKPDQCKAGKDGKLPEGCKAASAKKPAAKPEKPAAAKPEKTASAN